ncbi:MAG TPA: DNA adenine methylase [Gemmatimonadaceae bacterium]|nr:DNA adenine methylase [Gemmatimonadaceae bacterium]
MPRGFGRVDEWICALTATSTTLSGRRVPAQTDLFGSDSSSRGAEPFLKWAGGKRQLLPELRKRIPKSFGAYFEPFLGSGALFFALSPKSSFLSDANCELIAAYTAIRDRPTHVIKRLGHYRNTEADFNRVRSQEPNRLSLPERAARLIYLNRTCYNGLYRVNRKGQFNTPFGAYKNPTICNERVLLGASRALQGARLACADYKEALAGAKSGDFVYLDPPYVPVSQYSDFRRYHTVPFGTEEHERLRDIVDELARRGCYVMLSNSYTPFTVSLYKQWNVHRVEAKRLINKNPDGRRLITELLVTSY